MPVEIARCIGLPDANSGTSTRTESLLVAPADETHAFSEDEPLAASQTPPESPRYMFDSAGRRYPVNKYGTHMRNGHYASAWIVGRGMEAAAKV